MRSFVESGELVEIGFELQEPVVAVAAGVGRARLRAEPVSPRLVQLRLKLVDGAQRSDRELAQFCNCLFL